MVTEPEVGRPELEEDEGGGPVKSFLEHLEDLRWVLIKSLVAVGITMLGCLVAGDRLVAVLKQPLAQAQISTKKGHFVRFLIGGKELTSLEVDPSQMPGIDFTSNRVFNIQLAPVVSGTNLVLQGHIVPSGGSLRPTVELKNFGPVGGFFIAFQVAMYGGLVLAAPAVLYFGLQFVVPALKRKEKAYLFRGMMVGTFLFLSGVAFCYFGLLRFALAASVKYSQWLGFSADQWRAEEYISFVCKFMLGMGLGFEMPVVILTLVRIGLLDHAKLVKFRRYMIVLNLVLGALLTTPEVLTQVLMALPLQVLYEISIWIAWYWERKEKKNQTETELVDAETP